MERLRNFGRSVNGRLHVVVVREKRLPLNPLNGMMK